MSASPCYPKSDPPPVEDGHDEVDQQGTPQEPIDQTIADSFPASDPPFWTSGCDNKRPTQIGVSKDDEETLEQLQP